MDPSSPADHGLVATVRAVLADAGDPAVAARQQAYMKSAMPYHGLPAPRVEAGRLRHAVEATVAAPTFWLRKAIGWALRDHARTDPDWVRAEVARLGDRLSGLSRREALKHL